jgi:hypothetical protein
VPVYVDDTLCSEDPIAFNADTHRDAVRMRFRNFVKLVQPDIAPASRFEYGSEHWKIREDNSLCVFEDALEGAVFVVFVE